MIKDEMIGMEVSECKENVIRFIIGMQNNSNDGNINLKKVMATILDNAVLAYDDGTVIDIADVLTVIDKMVGEGELDLSNIDIDEEFINMMSRLKISSWVTTDRFAGFIYASDYYCNKNVIQKIIKTGKKLKHIKNPVTLCNIIKFRIEIMSSFSSDYTSLLTYALILEEDISEEEFEKIFKKCNNRLVRLSEECDRRLSIDAYTIKTGLKNVLDYIIALGDKDKYMHVIMKTLNGLFTNCKAGISRKSGVRNFIQETNSKAYTKMYERMERYNNEVEEFPFFKNFSKYYNSVVVESLLD